jgi:hypothetical protein
MRRVPTSSPSMAMRAMLASAAGSAPATTSTVTCERTSDGTNGRMAETATSPRAMQAMPGGHSLPTQAWPITASRRLCGAKCMPVRYGEPPSAGPTASREPGRRLPSACTAQASSVAGLPDHAGRASE